MAAVICICSVSIDCRTLGRLILHHNILLTHHHHLSCLFLFFGCCMRTHSSALVLSLSLFFLSRCGVGDCADGMVQGVSVAVLQLMPLGLAWLLSFAFVLFTSIVALAAG